MANQTEHVFTCPPLASGKPCAPSTCVTAFSKASGMLVVKTVSDGDCFFDALLLSGAIPVPHAPASAQRMYLRKQLVDYMMDHVDPAIMPHESIAELYEAHKYACDAGDLVPLYVPSAFGIRLQIYDLHREPSQHYVIMRYHYGTTGPIVRMLRSGEHYRLLEIPLIDSPEVTNAIPEPAKPAEPTNMYAAALQEARVLSANVRKAAQMTRHTNMKRKKAQENANAAYAASLMRQLSIENEEKSQENANAAYAASLAHNMENEMRKKAREKKAQENANAAYAASLLNGGRRTIRRMRKRSSKTRRR